MYEKLSALENLRFFVSLYKKQPRSIQELMSQMGLSNDADKRVSDYSKGMKARLNFIKALLHDPGLICLDEPTSGLDPANSCVMKDMMLALVCFVPAIAAMVILEEIDDHLRWLCFYRQMGRYRESFMHC